MEKLNRMSSNLPNLVSSILNTLLDQLEQPNRRRVVRVRLNEDQHHDYFYANDFAVRHHTNEALQHLAAQGCLRLHWRKWEEDNWLDKVDLVGKNAEAIYKLLGRTPLDEQETMLARLLAEHSPKVDWHIDFLRWVQRQLDTHASVAPLRLSTDAADVEWNRDLLAALGAMTELNEPMLERKFSVQLFGNSKRFEDLRQAIVRILRRHDPESIIYGDDGKALLRAHMLERTPEYVPIAGPLVLQTKDRLLDLTPFVPNVALPATILHSAKVSSCRADVLITVENLTSFNELAFAKPDSVLAIYTGGFASPTVIALLRIIYTKHPDLLFFHWSDMDVGGLRILAHLRKNFGGIKPLAMDVETFDRHHRHAQLLSANEREGLTQLRTHMDLADCVQLIDHLLNNNQKLEQEAINVLSITSALRAGW